MKIYLIAARSRNNVIGHNDEIPWRVTGEQKLFREITQGNTLVMGRKTFEAIGRALPGRDTVVVTRTPNYQAKGCSVAGSVEDALALAETLRGDCFVAGGGEIYRQTIARADAIHLTTIDLEVEGDTTFPDLPEGEFEVAEERRVHSNVDYTYQLWVRVTR